MDHKLMVTVKQKRSANKQQYPNKKQNKKKGPLKVVYITNPIKFNASASEFRALVQELTGQGSYVPESAMSVVDDGVGGEVAKAAVEDHNYVHAVLDEEGTKIGHTNCEVGQNGSDPILEFGLYDDDGFCGPHMNMMDSFEGLMTCSFWD